MTKFETSNSKKFWENKWEKDRREYEKTHEALWKYLRPQLKGIIVDLGCGSAGVARTLSKERVKKYIGIDFSKVAIDYAKKRFEGKEGIEFEFYIRDARNTMLPDKCADTVLISQTLEHFYDYDYLLKEAHRLCKNWLVLSVPINTPDVHHFYPRWSIKDIVDALDPYADAFHVVKRDDWVIYAGEVKR